MFNMICVITAPYYYWAKASIDIWVGFMWESSNFLSYYHYLVIFYVRHSRSKVLSRGMLNSVEAKLFSPIFFNTLDKMDLHWREVKFFIRWKASLGAGGPYPSVYMLNKTQIRPGLAASLYLYHVLVQCLKNIDVKLWRYCLRWYECSDFQ